MELLVLHVSCIRITNNIIKHFLDFLTHYKIIIHFNIKKMFFLLLGIFILLIFYPRLPCFTVIFFPPKFYENIFSVNIWSQMAPIMIHRKHQHRDRILIRESISWNNVADVNDWCVGNADSHTHANSLVRFSASCIFPYQENNKQLILLCFKFQSLNSLITLYSHECTRLIVSSVDNIIILYNNF